MPYCTSDVGFQRIAINATAQEETYLLTAMAAPSIMVMFIIMYSLWQPPRGAYKCRKPFLHGTTLISVILQPVVRSSLWCGHFYFVLIVLQQLFYQCLIFLKDFSIHFKVWIESVVNVLWVRSRRPREVCCDLFEELCEKELEKCSCAWMGLFWRFWEMLYVPELWEGSLLGSSKYDEGFIEYTLFWALWHTLGPYSMKCLANSLLLNFLGKVSGCRRHQLCMSTLPSSD